MFDLWLCSQNFGKSAEHNIGRVALRQAKGIQSTFELENRLSAPNFGVSHFPAQMTRHTATIDRLQPAFCFNIQQDVYEEVTDWEAAVYLLPAHVAQEPGKIEEVTLLGYSSQYPGWGIVGAVVEKRIFPGF